MVQRSEPIRVVERIELFPAQEKVIYGVEPTPVLSAEQAFSESLLSTSINDGSHAQGLIP